MARDVELELELYDAMEPAGKRLVQEYGMSLGLYAWRQFYGREEAARQWAEAERQRLQVVRWKNI